jgi:flavin-dependent dehydrogenase
MREVNQQEHSPAYEHALVIGGGIAGLLAARVLTDFFARVTIVERGERPDGVVFRKETPQAPHRHGLSVEGKRIFERLFPGLDAALAEVNCPVVAPPRPGGNHGADYMLVRAKEPPAGRAPKGSLGDRIMSRPRLEWEVLQRVESMGQVQFAWNRRVTKLLKSADNSHLIGVNTQERAGASETFLANLIVDASGRYSKINHWLADAGYETAEESVLDSTLLMVSQWFKIPANFSGDWEGLIIEPRHPYNHRSGMITKIEGRYFLLTLSGKAGLYPPTKEPDLMNYLKELRRPGIYNVLSQSEPLAPAHGYGNTQNRRRHFERLNHFPHNLIVMGDAVCVFNPGHAFGMGMASQCAELLQQSLQEQAGSGFVGFSRRFHEGLAAIIEPTWRFVTRADQYDLEHVWSHRLDRAMALPFEDEAHVARWQEYRDLAAPAAAWPVLQSRLVQLQFPIKAGISQTAVYRRATRQGIMPQHQAQEPLVLECPEQLRLEIYPAMFGPTPILSTANRADFVRLVQALAKRNEPVDVPTAVDTYLIAGLNNWDRLHALKLEWLRQHKGPMLAPDQVEKAWQQEFKRLIPQKALYQDRFIIAENRLQRIPAAELGLAASEWQRIAPLIRAEHAATYYMLPRLLGQIRDAPLHNELLAYYVAMVTAVGHFRADWFSRFIHADLVRETQATELPFGVGRLQTGPAPHEAADWLRRIAGHVAAFDHHHGSDWRHPQGILLSLLALDSLTLAELAAEDAVAQLEQSLAQLQQQLQPGTPVLLGYN